MQVVVSDAFHEKTPRFFNQNINNLQMELRNYVDMMGERLKAANSLEDYHYNLEDPGTSEILVYGRLYSAYQEDDPDESFLLTNAEIHFTKQFSESVPFLRFEVEEAELARLGGLFRGQIIAARGFADSRTFHASKIFTDARPAVPVPIADDFQAKIAIVAGPYVDENLDRVGELNYKLQKEVCPDYTIFIGPFAQESCKLLNSADCQFTAAELTETVINNLTEGLRCVVVTSIEDELDIPVMPHPPVMMYHGMALVKGDPCFVTLGGHFEIMATSYDMFSGIMKNYAGHNEARRDVAMRQIAHQNSACPVMEASVQLQYISSLAPERPPHVICSPSAFRMAPLHAQEGATHVISVPKNTRGGEFVLVHVNGQNIEVFLQK